MFLRRLVFSSLGLLLALPVKAEEYTLTNPFGGDTFKNPNELIAVIIRASLGVLGIVVLVFMIYAGFLWMTAGGGEEQINKAKKMFTWTIVGLFLVIASYAILEFVFTTLIGFTA